MSDLDDLEPAKSEEPGDETPPRLPSGGPPAGLVAGAMAMVVLVAGLAYLAFRKPAPPTPSPTPPATLPSPSPSPSPPAVALPALDRSDSLVRELARGLSAHPQLARWLGAEGLIRRLVAATENVADGESPRAHVGFLAAKEPFAVRSIRGRTFIDLRAYSRYDVLADGFAALDAGGCARVYRTLEPLFEAAYRELGHPQGGFAQVAGRAIARLLDTPSLDDETPVRRIVRVVPLYQFTDPRLEALAPAQKQLLRMGPRNARKVQAKLRELAAALGLEESSAKRR